jgi:phosphoglycolate phosphatase-like HAD superfamily hydrolase
VDTLIALERKHFLENINKVKVFPYVKSTLTKLKKSYKIALISNTRYDNILRSLDAAKLNPYFFDIIVGSDLVTHPKPYADELFLVEKILRHNIDFYIGDSPADMKAGKNVGIKTIGVATGVTKKDELCEYKPFAVLKCLRTLPKVIE